MEEWIIRRFEEEGTMLSKRKEKERINEREVEIEEKREKNKWRVGVTIYSSVRNCIRQWRVKRHFTQAWLQLKCTLPYKLPFQSIHLLSQQKYTFPYKLPLLCALGQKALRRRWRGNE